MGWRKSSQYCILPSLVLDDIRAALAYATMLAEENGGVAVVNELIYNNFLNSR
jgi:hypothetical protein